ncbi:MAG: DUF2142 domain-containing protein, partial [Chloroflexi bacterium]|nr:DUF2142 domain-containing protein [Chloroflexota bacterium]
MVTLLMGLMLVRGLLVGTIIWPWYAPDEADHVELALLTQVYGPVINHDMLSRPIRVAIAQSQFQWHVTERPPRADEEMPGSWAGQVGRQPPLYYLLAGWAAALAPTDDIVAQLVMMRLVSALIGSAIVGGAYVAARLLAPATPVVALGVAGVVLFQTATGLLAGAATNDILAIAGVTWVLIACLALLRGPRSARHLSIGLVTLTLAVAMALLSKRTTVSVIPPAALTVILIAAPLAQRWLRSPRYWVPALTAGMIVLGMLAAVVVGYDDHEARDWSAERQMRVPAGAPDLGRHALRFGDAATSPTISQPLPAPAVAAMRGQPITAGIWVRLANPQDSPRPAILRFEQRVGGVVQVRTTPVTVGRDWQFASLQDVVAPTATAVTFVVTASGPPSALMLIDGAALAVGAQTGTALPGATADTVVWDGEEVTNLLANASFEMAPFGLRQWLRDAIGRLVGRPYDQIVDKLMASLQAPESWEALRLQVV